ncbi:hypothetical protein F5B20DRAFT_404430 [Whalleya microplaca]|nr:hypothetical protein F5B20DRAFT_404430 [Whalleya microplaca]
MAIRYTVEALVFLRESPLCVKPSTLPPAEEWMGPPPDTFRNNQGSKPGADRSRNNENSLLEQTNRRPGADRHISRNSGNPDEIILGPTRGFFSSATIPKTGKAFENEKAVKDTETRGERFPFRPRNGDADNAERFRDRDRDRDRDGRNNLRRRGDGDQDSDGWSTVKPRKSFGHEGAERFHGRLGDRADRFGGERRVRDPDDRDNGDRPRRNFGEFSKDKEGEDTDKLRKNGPSKSRADQPWMRGNDDSQPARERFDRLRSWRDRGGDDNHGDAHHDKPKERTYDRRWNRDGDHRQERDPEWLDEPLEEPSQGRTQEDFKKFMESMKAGKNPAKAEAAPTAAVETSAPPERPEVEKTKVKSVSAIEMGPDKFFAAFAQSSNLETPGIASEVAKEVATPAPKPKSGSRFQNFFSSQEESRRQTEPPTPAAIAPPINEVNPFLAAAGTQQDPSEKAAFQALLQKLQKQTLQASTPPSAGPSEPPPSQDMGPKSAVASPGPFQLYGQERREEMFIRPQPQNQDIQVPRPQLVNPQLVNPQFVPAMRPEQHMLHDLIGQRHPGPNQRVERIDQPPSNRNSNSNTEFLMTLMQSARGPPEPQRNEQVAMRMPQPSRPTQIPPTPDRESDYPRDRGLAQLQGGRPTGLSTFFDEPPMHHREPESRPQQPTQILQRQGPPGLDQMHPAAWMQNGGQQLPPGRPMIPPPGLAANPRNGPLPGGFPPNYPMAGFPPDGMAGPPRNMAPPPGFYGGPPPPPAGFMPPGMGGFQGPESLGFGFDGRGMPPPGVYRRN